MSSDPLTDIEDERSQRDVGVTAHRIFAGAREDGASTVSAFWVTAAWFYAALKANEKEPGE